MATVAEARAAEERRLLDGFDVYDRAVDVVSVFEWLHTDAAGVPATVRHFERYPSLVAPDGNQATPDFTILFNRGAALVGEIARFSLREESVNGLCAQLGRYDTLTGVPSSRGSREAADVDVMYLVEMKLGMPAVQRILKDRLARPGHPYKPSRPPVVVQYARESDRYTFQRIPDPTNGTLRDDGRDPSVGEYLSTSGLGIRPAKFAHVKAARAFVNDQMDPLYLATHLWAKTLPTRLGRPSAVPVVVTEADLAQSLRDQYGLGKVKDVHNALVLLDKAGLAAAGDTKGEWQVAWHRPRISRGRDLHQTIAARAAGISTAARAIPSRPHHEPPREQLTLFP